MKALVAATALILTTGVAQAVDTYNATPEGFTWSGLYVGGHFG